MSYIHIRHLALSSTGLVENVNEMSNFMSTGQMGNLILLACVWP